MRWFATVMAVHHTSLTTLMALKGHHEGHEEHEADRTGIAEIIDGWRSATSRCSRGLASLSAVLTKLQLTMPAQLAMQRTVETVLPQPHQLQ